MRRLARVGLLVAVVASLVGAVQFAGAQADTCPVGDGWFKFDVGTQTWEPSAPDGVTVVSASEEQVVFDIAAGVTVVDVCYKTGNGVNTGDATVEPPPPVEGPATLTITSSGGPGAGLSHISLLLETTTTTTSTTSATTTTTTTIPEVEPPFTG